MSEARKFGVSVVAANQFLDQYPTEMRAAVLSVGTHIFFQLSSADAGTVAQMLDGGKSLAEKLKNLPQRRFIVKSGAEHWREATGAHGGRLASELLRPAQPFPCTPFPPTSPGRARDRCAAHCALEDNRRGTQ